MGTASLVSLQDEQRSHAMEFSMFEAAKNFWIVNWMLKNFISMTVPIGTTCADCFYVFRQINTVYV